MAPYTLLPRPARRGRATRGVLGADSRPVDGGARGYQALGVGVLQSGTWTSSAGTGRFADLDTAPEGGGMTVRLEYDPDSRRQFSAGITNDDPFTRITQYAFVVRDVHKVSAFYERLGLGALPSSATFR